MVQISICVGCGLDVNAQGVLIVDRNPDTGVESGLACTDPGGLSLAIQHDGTLTGLGTSTSPLHAVNDGSAAAAMAAANEADDTADAAQGSANIALDRVPNKIRWGFRTGATDASGAIGFTHNLGVIPSSVVLTPFNNTATCDWMLTVENMVGDPNNCNVQAYNTTTGAKMGVIGVSFCWFAAI